LEIDRPTILSLSGQVVDSLLKNNKINLLIDLKPALERKKLDARLIRDFASRRNEPFKSILRGIMAKDMVAVCLEATNISGETLGGKITSKERKRLLGWLKEFKLEVTGYRPFKEAIITQGGVDTKEVNPRTMESKIVKGLFITGELLDLQATIGGYNLQAAFSTGYIAGTSQV
jgi:predicted Rossmann fold flavoprotein